jgi:hypothetical protein
MFATRTYPNNVTGSKLPDRLTNQPKAWWQRAIAGERLPNPLFRRSKCEGTVEDYRNIALDVRELIRKRVFEQPVGSTFRLQHCLSMAACDAAKCFNAGSRSRHRSHRRGAAGLGQLRRYGKAHAATMPVVCSARLHALSSPRQGRLSALQWPLVCSTADQQQRPKSPSQAKNPPQAW